MKDTEQKTVRFYANNPKHKEAWEYLHQLDKDICSSQQDFIIDAINSYYHKMAELKDDPYLETREREEEFIKRITHGVMEQLTADLPKVVGGFLIGLLAGEADGVSSIGRALAKKYTSGAGDEKTVCTSPNVEVKQAEIKADISEEEVADNEYLDLDNIF
ncbi:MAG: hypothetical protein PHX08_11580 [Lachnospiraceae bacterium]|nr:hypothetical protein [Lachnospiraceae bacterium]